MLLLNAETEGPRVCPHPQLLYELPIVSVRDIMLTQLQRIRKGRMLLLQLLHLQHHRNKPTKETENPTQMLTAENNRARGAAPWVPPYAF